MVRALLADGSEGGAVALARALRPARLLACVVAIADEVDEHGGDTSSHMAAVSMVNERGERGLLAFSGVDSLAAWNPEARPMPASGRELGRSALEDGATAIVIDVAGPQRVVLAGAALAALADELDMDAVVTAVLAALTPLTVDGAARMDVSDARDDGGAADVMVTVTPAVDVLPPGSGPNDLALQVARILAERPDIQRMVPGGIGISLTP